jgi:hypothetical protein
MSIIDTVTISMLQVTPAELSTQCRSNSDWLKAKACVLLVRRNDEVAAGVARAPKLSVGRQRQPSLNVLVAVLLLSVAADGGAPGVWQPYLYRQQRRRDVGVAEKLKIKFTPWILCELINAAFPASNFSTFLRYYQILRKLNSMSVHQI